VKLQGTRLLVRALSPQWDTSAAPALWAEEELHRVEPLALEAAFLRYPLESWGVRHYPWELEQLSEAFSDAHRTVGAAAESTDR
jgi:hypothetical protein